MLHALESLFELHLIAVWVGVIVDPGSFVKTVRLDHQRVSVPVAHRVAVPRRFGISGERPPIEVDGAVHVKKIEELRGSLEFSSDQTGTVVKAVIPLPAESGREARV